MQSKYELSGKLADDCKSVIFDRGNSLVRILPNWLNKPIHVVISLLDEDRSLQQNKYFHAVICGIIGDFLKETQGRTFTMDQIKMFIYVEVLGAEFVEVEIAQRTYYELTIKRSHQWGKKEFSEKKEAIQKFFAELDIMIPDPDPEYYTKLQHLIK
jgi:hypothetical protein